MIKWYTKPVAWLLSVLLLITPVYNAPASESGKIPDAPGISDFYCDEAAIGLKMIELNNLAEFLDEHPDETFASLKEKGSLLIANLEEEASPGIWDENGPEPPLGIPSFLWGCVFGFAGIIVVAIMTDKNKEEIQKSLYGCITATAVVVVAYVLMIGALVTYSVEGAY